MQYARPSIELLDYIPHDMESEGMAFVSLREIIESDVFANASNISFALGRDAEGNVMVCDLKQHYHLLAAFSSYREKEVFTKNVLTSILFKGNPDDVKILFMDINYSYLYKNFEGCPHLLAPFIIDYDRAMDAFFWTLQEMHSRYKLFAKTGTRDIESYNGKLEKEGENSEQIPHIIILVNELADLMFGEYRLKEDENGYNGEDYINRIASMGRLAGIHLIISTRSPSVDIVTGVIKANIPSTLSFFLTSTYDSKLILNRSGAEKLMGKGDMLYHPLGDKTLKRGQGCYITDEEFDRITSCVKTSNESRYANIYGAVKINKYKYDDELYEEVVQFAIEQGTVKRYDIQRKFRIGYLRAKALIELMEERGVIETSKKEYASRRVFVSHKEEN